MRERVITFRLRLPAAPRKRWLLAGATALVCFGAVVYAAVPNVFNPGDSLSAGKVNANFSDLDGRSWSGSSTTRYYNDGSVGIGTSTPTAQLHVVGSTNEQIRLQGVAVGAPNYAYVAFGDSAGTRTGYVGDGSGNDTNIFLASDSGSVQLVTNAGRVLTVTPGGNVGIGVGNNSPAYLLDVAGTIRGSNVSPSDARLKTDVRTLDGALDGVSRLRGVRFTWKKDGKPSIGVIAQEVEAVYPELVSTAPDGMKSVDYGKFAGVLIEATKALRRENATMRAENAALKERLDRLEMRLQQRATR